MGCPYRQNLLLKRYALATGTICGFLALLSCRFIAEPCISEATPNPAPRGGELFLAQFGRRTPVKSRCWVSAFPLGSLEDAFSAGAYPIYYRQQNVIGCVSNELNN